MLKLVLLAFNLLSVSIILACSCQNPVSEFCHGADTSDYIALFEVIEKPDETYLSLVLLENINKEIPEDTIKLIGYAGHQCGMDVNIFNVGDTLVLNLNFTEHDLYHYMSGEIFNWWLGDCWREHLWYSNGNVFGPITHQIDTMEYAEFKKNILECLDFFLSTSKIKEQKFEIYPNPTSGVINIESTDNLKLDIAIYNSCGVLSAIRRDRKNKITRINLSELRSGIYFLQIRVGNEFVNRRIVKI